MFTKQKCKKCGGIIEIDAMVFLLNLDNDDIRICKKCKEKESLEGKK